MLLTDKIYIAGHAGLVWSAIVRALEQQGYTNLVFKSYDELDLTNQAKVNTFFANERPAYIFLAAAKVGGIMANKMYPAEFLYQNLQIQSNVIHAAYTHNAKKLLFLWSSCIYPKYATQPITEDALLTWALEPSNEPYAIAKIAGIKLCQSYNRQYGTNFIACMPTNIYGPRDNFDIQTAHVIPALIHKFVKAKATNTPADSLRGDGSPKREFLYVDDLADACIFLMNTFVPTAEQNEQGNIFVNVGQWKDISLLELAEIIKQLVWYTGPIDRDTSKPNGTPRKLLNTMVMESLGRKPKVDLMTWLKQAIEYFQTHYSF